MGFRGHKIGFAFFILMTIRLIAQMGCVLTTLFLVNSIKRENSSAVLTLAQVATAAASFYCATVTILAWLILNNTPFTCIVAVFDLAFMTTFVIAAALMVSHGICLFGECPNSLVLLLLTSFIAAFFLITALLHVYLHRLYRKERQDLAIAYERYRPPFSAINAEKDERNTEEIDGRSGATSGPALEDASPEIMSSSHRPGLTETGDGAIDDLGDTSAALPTQPAANPTATNEPAIPNSTALRHEREQPSHLAPLPRAVASPLWLSSEGAPAGTSSLVDHQPKPSATPKTRKQGDRAKRSSDGCGCCPAPIRQRTDEHKSREPYGTVPENWGTKLKTPRGQREPRPKFTRTAGSMVGPWKPGPGIRY